MSGPSANGFIGELAALCRHLEIVIQARRQLARRPQPKCSEVHSPAYPGLIGETRLAAPEQEGFQRYPWRELGNAAVQTVEIVAGDILVELVLFDFHHRRRKGVDAVATSRNGPARAIEGTSRIGPWQRAHQTSVAEAEL